MTVIINGSGTANGISYFSSPTTFGGTLATASRGISNASVPSGSVLQVIQSTYSVYSSTTSSSYVNTGLSLTIIPFSATSKILLMLSLQGIYADINSTFSNQQFTRNGVSIVTFDSISGYTSTGATGSNCSFNYLDSPATTSSISYVSQICRATGTGTIRWNNNTPSSTSSFIAMEIAQ